MSKGVFATLMVAACALALALRLAAPDRRPMHHDEANQALKFGALLETGEYKYDPLDHHGPTLYYLTLPVAWLRGQATLASLDERTLRLVPGLFGAGLILLLPLLAGGLGRTAVVGAALLTALSPALTYYSRFYIQETLFVFFALAFLLTLGRYSERPGAGWAIASGIAAGLAYATKETSVIVLPAAIAALLFARFSTKAARATPVTGRAGHVILTVLSGVSVAYVLYTSFLRNRWGFIESMTAISTYVGRGVDAGAHAHPWSYYLQILAYSESGGLVWTEGIVLLLALVGLVAAVKRSGVVTDSGHEPLRFWPRYVACYSVITAVAFSSISYKTPWNLLPLLMGFVLLAGYGAAALISRFRSRAARAVLMIVLLSGACHLGFESWRASFRYAADPRNPYVYAQTVPDFLRLVQRVVDLAAVHPDHEAMLVEVVAAPTEQWPLPWYLRRMTRVGYWLRAEEPGRPADASVIVASEANAARLDAALGERYVAEFYGLRPGVLLTVYVERGLWTRFLELRQGG
jgi:uncharacterized protein (TIGR03663 family)